MKVNQLFSYIINYKPLLNYSKEIKKFNKIYCKNFFLFFLLLDFINKNKNKAKLSIYKKNYFFTSFLRAPNKYKKAQIKLNLVRYKVAFSFTNLYDIEFIKLNYSNNFAPLIYFINYFFYFFLFFESTSFFLEKKKILIKLNPKILTKLLFEL